MKIDTRTDLEGYILSTVIISADKYFFFRKIIDEPFILVTHKCVPSANSKDLDEITHFIRFYTACYMYDKKGSSEKEM